jgi:hypothetical protein
MTAASLTVVGAPGIREREHRSAPLRAGRERGLGRPRLGASLAGLSCFVSVPGL